MRRETTEGVGQLEDLAGALLDLLAGANSTTRRLAARAMIRGRGHVALLFDGDNGINRLGKNLVHTAHLLTTALDIGGTHALGHAVALFRCDGSEALGFQELDAGSFVAQIGLEPHQDEWSCRAKV